MKKDSVSHWIVPNINTMEKFLEFLRQKKHKVTLFYLLRTEIYPQRLYFESQTMATVLLECYQNQHVNY